MTTLGESWHGRAEDLATSRFSRIHGAVDLIVTSPPFPLLNKKRYGNLTGDEYVHWLASFAPLISKLLSPTGSLVIEMGNAWNPGLPTMSTLPLKALLSLQEAGDFHLCQQFVWHNPARLPSPAQWVTIERIRVKDSFTHIWWLSKNTRPKANNRNVLKPYSESMKRLLKRGSYNSGTRPSEHYIGDNSFYSDNGGAIAPNVFTVSNTRADNDYLRYCRQNRIRPHPARMPDEIAGFFVKFLTDPGDLVVDLFGGSNTTGALAEQLGRHWLVVEPKLHYILGSVGRFEDKITVSTLESTSLEEAIT